MLTNCAALHKLASTLPVFCFPFTETAIPLNGIYFLFEQGEKGHGTNRLVRIGTHTGKNQLRSRLKQHFLTENKDRSIFRKNIGRCLLHQTSDPFLKNWELDLTPKASRDKFSSTIDWKKQASVEGAVSAYIRSNFSFVVIPIEEKTARLTLESKIISTISLCKDCSSSPNWLGQHSPKEKIRQSGLWLVNELYKEPLSKADLTYLKSLCDKKYQR